MSTWLSVHPAGPHAKNNPAGRQRRMPTRGARILDSGVLVTGVRGRLDLGAMTDEDNVALPAGALTGPDGTLAHGEATQHPGTYRTTRCCATWSPSSTSWPPALRSTTGCGSGAAPRCVKHSVPGTPSSRRPPRSHRPGRGVRGAGRVGGRAALGRFSEDDIAEVYARAGAWPGAGRCTT